MRIPRHWARASEGGRTALGWSEASAGDAERMARERLQRLLSLGDRAPVDWGYYPSTPVKEEIVETHRIAGSTALVTRNRAGALVLNTETVAFVDVDVETGTRGGSLLGALGRLLRRSPAPDPLAAALARIRNWAEERRARLRAYRTARGLRLLRLDATMHPDGEECQRMFAELGADPQYARLCRAQRSFRARLTPKPARVGCTSAPGSHPRVERAVREQFREWLTRYEEASARAAVCAPLEELGSGPVLPPCQAVAALHDGRTVRANAALA